VAGAAGSAVNVTCGVNVDDDPENDLTRTFQLVNIVNEIPEEALSIATALAVIKEGPQAQNGAQINPAPGGEAIIRILPNGVLSSWVNVQISFAETSVPGAELRNLDGTPVILPKTITLPQPFGIKRYVVYAPASCSVIVKAIEVSSSGLASGSETILFGDVCYGNFDGDQDEDGTDVFTFKVDFGRSSFNRPCTSLDTCNGDFTCDGDVDGTDACLFKSDFGRGQFNNPCPACISSAAWCSY
jgi:hypothetical protein